MMPRDVGTPAAAGQLLVGLDIGTSKVVALVGQVTPEGGIEIIGLGSHESRGLKRGVVVNIESTVQSVQRAIQEAEQMAECRIHSVWVGIAGSHIRSENVRGIISVANGEVTRADVDRVIDAARQIAAVSADQRILHVMPQEYVVDEQEGVRDPVGMSGMRLEAHVHVVTCSANAAQNIEKCVRRCGLEVEGLVLEQMASALAVLTDDEKELGVCLVDIGGGTTDIAVFTEGSVRHTAVIPIAGDQVTNDIAMALRTPTQDAEEIKTKYACALTQLARADETVKVPSVGERGPRDLSRQSLAEVVEPRYDELFTFVQGEMRRSGLEDMLAAGVVLTGGSSRIEGAIELAEEIFHAPVRVGLPVHGVRGLADLVRNPVFSTGVGLLLFARQRLTETGWQRRPRPGEGERSMLTRLRGWMKENF